MLVLILAPAGADQAPALDRAKIIHADRARAAQLGRDRQARTFAERRDAMTAQLRTEIASRSL